MQRKKENVPGLKVGTLVLFPSYLWHGTMPISGDEPRMTVAYDAVCVDP